MTRSALLYSNSESINTFPNNMILGIAVYVYR